MRLLRELGLLAVALGVVGGMTGRATASVLTFDAQPTGSFTTLTENGFALNFIGFGNLQAVADLGGGNRALVDSNPFNVSGAEVFITQIGGGAFDLNSLDIANLANPGGGPTTVGTGAGFRIELISNTGDIIAYSTGSSTFSTISPSGFTDITFLRLNIVSLTPGNLTFAVDNINLTAVPEPSSLASAAFGAALLAAYWRRRHPRVRAA
jgi:hypothetical protein